MAKQNTYSIFKRLLDIAFSFFLLVLLFPFLLTIAIVITFTMSEFPLFLQKRPGKNEKIFTLVKFKTMRNTQDKNSNILPDKERLTPLGSFLRKYSLDELPELWNVLCGDMSFVGPRPLLIQYLPFYTKIEKKRHAIRPGITGLAQISGRNYLEWNKRLSLDVEYVDNLSFSLDLKIIEATIRQVFKASGVAVNSEIVEPYLDEIRKNQTND